MNTSTQNQSAARVGVLWPGDPRGDVRVTPESCRLHRVLDALAAGGATPVPVVYADEAVAQTRTQLLGLDGVLVWVNPIEKGLDRSALDAMLRQVANAGVFVSAHPDVILKMGTKEVLHRTRDIGWGCDTHLYVTFDDLQQQLPIRLAEGAARVLKQYRGNGGDGVWKVELSGTVQSPGLDSVVRVRHALRGAVEEQLPLREFVRRCQPYFARDGRIIDQPYQARLPEGMTRCYLSQNKVVGFGHQAINALYPSPPGALATEAPQPGPRLYSGPTDPRFQSLKTKLETDWVPALQRVLDIDTLMLPVIWDADFLLGPKIETGQDTYVLCEINVSSVFPFPDDALVPMSQAAVRATLTAKRKRSS